jgi:hypothetical protein
LTQMGDCGKCPHFKNAFRKPNSTHIYCGYTLGNPRRPTMVACSYREAEMAKSHNADCEHNSAE